ncbi:mannonate dehydratase [Gracilibacillus ureilyticus]|uniref:Mannonate dehydratase n=1 Tax=Gracilibacillus ureilyticus TaxID=531814 RepID=A0A1H9PRE8_9BACI|nr:mannonate dehydratase [Gracilibacillus ureilyticus]SER50369.1 mannonate dehydratase [Gracilibacillus ureilyticus]
MNMVFRWFGEGNDSVTLSQIRQIPGVKGLVWALHDIPAGDIWPLERIQECRRIADKYHLHLKVVESVNIHESIKLGSPDRDVYIANYIQTIKNLSTIGVKVICYNFMPVFDWIRTDLFGTLPDKSTALFYEKAKVENMDPIELVNRIATNPEYTMPGWEPERLEALKELFEAYLTVTTEDLMANLQYFLERVIPVCEEYDVKMAIHPDDPPWEMFGLPRIVTTKERLLEITSLVDSHYNGITLCSGALGVRKDNNIVEMIYELKDRIHFAHIRNVKLFNNGDFIETSHYTADGSLPIDKIVKAYHEIGYRGYVRPDHGRHIWDEVCRPGYGLYDRALGVMYLSGLWDAYQLSERVGETDVTNKHKLKG